MSELRNQVMWNRLISIVEEQALALVRAAFSTSVREAGDLSAGVYDVEGRMIAQAITGTPGQRSRIRATGAQPSIRGSAMSVITRSTEPTTIRSRALSASSVSITSSSGNARHTRVRTPASSSTRSRHGRGGDVLSVTSSVRSLLLRKCDVDEVTKLFEVHRLLQEGIELIIYDIGIAHVS